MPCSDVYLRRFNDLLYQFLNESAKLINYYPDFTSPPGEIINWFKTPEHRLMHRNQSELVSFLYMQLYVAFQELEEPALDTAPVHAR